VSALSVQHVDPSIDPANGGTLFQKPWVLQLCLVDRSRAPSHESACFFLLGPPLSTDSSFTPPLVPVLSWTQHACRHCLLVVSGNRRRFPPRRIFLFPSR